MIKKIIRLFLGILFSPIIIIAMFIIAFNEWLSDEPNWEHFKSYWKNEINWFLSK